MENIQMFKTLMNEPAFAAKINAMVNTQTHFTIGDYTASSPKAAQYCNNESTLYTINESDIRDEEDNEEEICKKSQKTKKIIKTTKNQKKKRFEPPVIEEERPKLTMTINKNIIDKRNEEIEQLKIEKEQKKQQKSDKKIESTKRTLNTFNWKENHTKCFFKHYKVNEKKYLKANGRMKKYEMWNSIAKGLGEDLLENEEEYVPTAAQCESRMKHMRSTYQKNIDHNRISGNDRASKCAYFDEVDELFGYRPGVNPTKTLSTDMPGSSSSSSNVSVNEDCDEPQKKKRKYVSSTETSTKSILEYLKNADVKREERENRRINLAEKMHKDKMGILKQLVCLMKGTGVEASNSSESDDE